MDSAPGAQRSKMPPLRALLAFDAAARHESFAQGALELGVTPSAVSHQIQQLEDFLGVRLFLRQAGRAVLTNAGQAYAREIECAFGTISNATKLVAPQSQTGYLVIASGPSFGVKWLQPRLADFLKSHPDLRIRLSTLSRPDDLATGRYDVAITYGRPPSRHRHVEPLLSEKLRPLCSPSLAKSLHLTELSDLSRATLIHSANALTWAEYFRRVGRADLQMRNELWLDRSMMAIDAAVDGMGVVLESEVLASRELDDGRLFAPFEDKSLQVETTTYFLIKAGGSHNKPQTVAFERWLRSAIAQANSSN